MSPAESDRPEFDILLDHNYTSKADKVHGLGMHVKGKLT